MSAVRLATVGFVLAACAMVNALHTEPEWIPASSLAAVPFEVGPWYGRNDPPLDADVLAVLRADEYLLRTYARAEGPPVGLYVAFYASQQTGATIHSPLNCLPGSGWEPIERVRLRVTLPGGTAAFINRYIVQKGTDRQAVFYWFQSRGRVVASEYASRVRLVRDALTSGRGDGALVRVTVPLRGRADEANGAALRFIDTLYPVLTRHLPR
jgi:EpsI family protein